MTSGGHSSVKRWDSLKKKPFIQSEEPIGLKKGPLHITPSPELGRGQALGEKWSQLERQKLGRLRRGFL